MTECLSLKKSNCKNCYKCIRHCPVKSIRFSGNQAHIVPEDCMDLEMLDGYLAGVLISPRPIAAERWMPGVWSAHGDEAGFGSGTGLQRAIRLVKAYHNELLATLGLDDDDETSTASTVTNKNVKSSTASTPRAKIERDDSDLEFYS